MASESGSDLKNHLYQLICFVNPYVRPYSLFRIVSILEIKLYREYVMIYQTFVVV